MYPQSPECRPIVNKRVKHTSLWLAPRPLLVMECFSAAALVLRWSAGRLINQRPELSHPSIQAAAACPWNILKRQSRSIQQPLKSTESRIPVNDLAGESTSPRKSTGVSYTRCVAHAVGEECVQSGRSLRAWRSKSPAAVLRLDSAAPVSAGRSWLTGVGRQPSVCSPDSWAFWGLIVFQASA